VTAVSVTKAGADSTTSVLVAGLENPRGLTFGPDGQLYVAEGGLGGTTFSTTPEQCQQVPAPVGPYTAGAPTSRISRIDPQTGARSTLAGGLPSSQTAAGAGGFVSGVADVTFVGNTLYAITAGAGCSHGLVGSSNGLLRVNSDGSTTQVADLSGFQATHPVANPNPGDFEPDGTWYSMVSVRGVLYAVEPNHGEVDAITPAGNISRLIDISASQGHIVPTASTYHGNLYVCNLNVFDPGANGHASVYKITPSGNITVVASGLTACLGVAVQRGQIFALESFTGFFAPAPFEAGTGAVVRLNHSGGWDTIVSGLTFPTGMTFGPDGSLYISNQGYAEPTNTEGQIIKATLPDS
jgi:hypothetical protein